MCSIKGTAAEVIQQLFIKAQHFQEMLDFGCSCSAWGHTGLYAAVHAIPDQRPEHWKGQEHSSWQSCAVYDGR
jgi:hypothetical protein